MKKVRNPYAMVATLRSGGGPHRDHRKGRGGSRNEQADLMEEWLDDSKTGSREAEDMVESS